MVDSYPPEEEVVDQPSPPSPTNGGRRRSMSVATAQPSVETVVVKAKRAATTLWTLLHAQSCVLGNRCPHSGCTEARNLHLHLKTCSADSEVPCPTNHHGCEQARKLLAHYRRCRSLRARQSTSRSSPHVCLVCSMVARQARSALERSSNPSRKIMSQRRVAPSISIQSDDDILQVVQKMPPPPPRSMKDKSPTRLTWSADVVDHPRARSVSFQEAPSPQQPERRSRSLSLGATCETIDEAMDEDEFR